MSSLGHVKHNTLILYVGNYRHVIDKYFTSSSLYTSGSSGSCPSCIVSKLLILLVRDIERLDLSSAPLLMNPLGRLFMFSKLSTSPLLDNSEPFFAFFLLALNRK